MILETLPWSICHLRIIYSSTEKFFFFGSNNWLNWTDGSIRGLFRICGLHHYSSYSGTYRFKSFCCTRPSHRIIRAFRLDYSFSAVTEATVKILQHRVCLELHWVWGRVITRTTICLYSLLQLLIVFHTNRHIFDAEGRLLTENKSVPIRFVKRFCSTLVNIRSTDAVCKIAIRTGS